MPKSVLAALPAALLRAAASLGHPESALREAAGLDAAALRDPDGRVPIELHARLWEALAARGETIGIDLGERLGESALGVVGLAMRHSSNVGEALACLMRYRRLVLEDAVPVLSFERRRGRRVAVLTQKLPTRFAAMRHPAECQVASTLTWIRRASGTRVEPLSVALPHPPGRDPSRHARVFGPSIVWCADVAELVLDAATLEHPIAHPDASAHGYLEARAAVLLGAIGDRSFQDAVREVVTARLASGAMDKGTVSRHLGASARTLQRRLEAEGTSFAAIVDSVREARARVLLADPERSIGAVAYELGFAEPATFTRAFRRWTGTTPQAHRSRLESTRRSAT